MTNYLALVLSLLATIALVKLWGTNLFSWAMYYLSRVALCLIVAFGFFCIFSKMLGVE